ncbi:MAG: hypothetical protein M3P24_07905, partial [Gemmatimonadota bacterium]|nr:hypothetical protein [Gemmatimonadota bacterium]
VCSSSRIESSGPCDRERDQQPARGPLRIRRRSWRESHIDRRVVLPPGGGLAIVFGLAYVVLIEMSFRVARSLGWIE